MTPQEIFDKVATHLFTQCKQANDGGGCLYRTSYGLLCAAGCLLPDEFYKPEMERNTFILLVEKYPELPTWFKQYRSLINALQGVHDLPSSLKSSSLLKKRLEYVADTYNLNPSILIGLELKELTHAQV